ncbi:Fluctuating-Light- Acclimation Protein1 [Hibiscus trionum]|uniref:Fluctuating-Light- Acclimation Protein1 n=1 Tax=Hibiscus trionum TaxID=183268 RepID=A0A9W7GUE9_HIBTR|nr:Fluctuating-Light- Acclimation Protein1 [Hibiscus trionum]
MATSTSSLLQSNTFNFKHCFPLHLPLLSPPRLFKFAGTLALDGHRSAKLTVKCFFSSEKRKHLASSSLGSNDELSSSSIDNNPFDVIAQTISKALNALKKPALAAVLLGLLLMYDPNNAALAASGGRMGGRSFSSSSSSSRSYSVPRNGGSRFSSYSVPYYAPAPFGGGGFFMGPAVGVGAGSSLFFILVGFAAFVLVSGFLSDRSESSVLTATEKTTVLKLQVGLLGMGRSLQKDLNRIAKVADTSTSEGLSFVLTETTLALLRHPDYCISGYSYVDVKRSIDDGEKRFNQLSIEERGKFDEETLVNVNNIKRQSTSSQKASGFSNEYIVITILVAAEGVHKLPPINGSGDLKEALQKLASIPSSKIMAVEVLWTPQNEDDILSERELLEDYPLLRPL